MSTLPNNDLFSPGLCTQKHALHLKGGVKSSASEKTSRSRLLPENTTFSVAADELMMEGYGKSTKILIKSPLPLYNPYQKHDEVIIIDHIGYPINS